MDVEFDKAKNEKNIVKHGISFVEAADFDYFSAQIEVDSRKDYGETRYIALGYLYERLHVLCCVERPNGIRVISLRKANLRERNKYEKKAIH